MSQESPRRSTLLEMLREAAGLGTRPMGFGAVERRRSPRNVLLVILPKPDRGLAEAAVRAGADALLAEAPAKKEVTREALAQIGRAAANVPCGLYFESGSVFAGDQAFPSEGLDFVLARAEDAPPSFLRIDAGRGVVVDHELPLPLVRGLGDLPLDFIALAPTAATSPTLRLTVREMLALRALVEGIRKPVILSSAYLGGPEEVAALDDLGIDSLLLDVRAAVGSADTLRALVELYRKALDALSGRSRRRRESEVLPTLPRLNPRPLEEAEPDEPEERYS
jgi:hypothetical protein